MTFIMDPLLYPSVIKHGRQLDFHEFAERVAPLTFGYPNMETFPGLQDQIRRAYQLLQGDSLKALTESMMGNLMLLFRQDHLDQGSSWRSSSMYQFCSLVMFEASFLTIYGQPETTRRHPMMHQLWDDFVKFDNMFPYLMAEVPIWLLGRTKTVRKKLVSHLLPQQLSRWSNTCQFIQTRSDMLDQYKMRDVDKAGRPVLSRSSGLTQVRGPGKPGLSECFRITLVPYGTTDGSVR